MTQDSSDPQAVYRIGTPPAAPKKTRKNKRLFLFLAAALAVVLIAVGGALVWLVYQKVGSPVQDALKAAIEPPLVTAQKKCAPGSPYAKLGDAGKTLILQSSGKEQAGIDYTQLECFLAELKVTDAVRSEIGATRALDGRRSAEWGNFHASWSYHPDSGLDMTITTG